MPRRGGAIAEPREPFKPVTTDPLPRASDAHTGRRSRRYDRPTLIDNKLAEAPPASPTESRVSVQIHPVTSLGAELPLTALSLQGGPDEPTSSGTTPRRTCTDGDDGQTVGIDADHRHWLETLLGACDRVAADVDDANPYFATLVADVFCAARAR